MDIHKPKPVHSFREFLSEIGVVVLGIVIALSGEQAIEALHWRHVIEAERQALDDTVAGVYASMLSRVDLQDCVDARLSDVATVLQRHDAGRPLGIVAPVGRLTESVQDISAFDMATADGALAHMPLEEQEKYFHVFGTYRLFKIDTDEERENWTTLLSLERTSTFTPTDWADVRKAYDRAADINSTLKIDLRSDRDGYWLTPLKPFPKPAPKDYSLRFLPRVKQLCQPMIKKD